MLGTSRVVEAWDKSYATQNQRQPLTNTTLGIPLTYELLEEMSSHSMDRRTLRVIVKILLKLGVSNSYNKHIRPSPRQKAVLEMSLMEIPPGSKSLQKRV